MKDDFFSFREKMLVPVKPTPTGEPLTVQQLTQQIDRAIKSGVPETVRVRGELSNVKYHTESGHIYFTLKDANACIDGAMYRGENTKLKFRLETGMDILVSGRVGVFASRGRYQLVATRIEPLGRGSIEIAFRQLYGKLQRRGWFDPSRKKPLPRFPTRIALVTSQSTAALQDLLKVLRRHRPIGLAVFHVPVQGEGSAERMADALRTIHAHNQRQGDAKFDLLLLARGGGSAEDLWEFNEEVLAAAMIDCAVPIITGIGHEVDQSIADFVADHWAHTPTEAAQVAVMHWRTVEQTLEAHASRGGRLIAVQLQQASRHLQSIERHEFFRKPSDRLQQLQQRIDDRQQALAASLQRQAQRQRDRLDKFATRLAHRDPHHAIHLLRQRLNNIDHQLHTEMRQGLERRSDRLSARERVLTAISPRSVLGRGYTITTRKKDGSIARTADDIKSGEILITRFVDGQVESIARDRTQMRMFE